MVTYREEYEFAGTSYGIEDLEQPGDHFMPERQKKRFHCWLNGCGMGSRNTLREARLHIFGYAIKKFHREIREITNRIAEIGTANDEIRRLQSLMGDE